MTSAIAQSHPNIAFIKYWGSLDQQLNIPANSSLSMNLDGLHTRTRVVFDPDLRADTLSINDRDEHGPALARASRFLDRVRMLAEINHKARVISENNFPAGAGIASSASAFAALALASSHAAGLDLSEMDLSRLARAGSGSASRSIPGGFVEWQAGREDQDSYAFSIAPPEHWDLVDCITLVSEAHKPVGSVEGHLLAATSPLQTARLEGAAARLEDCRRAIMQRDFNALARVTELDSNLMHAVMITSQPALLYWQPATLEVMKAVIVMRSRGLPAFYTIDAGPNVHVITTSEYAAQVTAWLEDISGIRQIYTASPGGPACLVEDRLDL
jgi:diphosphomevalonate decarboxylase